MEKAAGFPAGALDVFTAHRMRTWNPLAMDHIAP
jgi:hypothetical protein